MRLGYLGPLADHFENLRRLMDSAGVNLIVVPDSLESGVYGSAATRSKGTVAKLRRFGKRAYAQMRGTSDRRYVEGTIDLLEQHQVDCLLAYWGTMPIADIIAIKRRRPQTKIVLNLLCHPLGLSHLKVAAQNRYLRYAMQYIDGVVAASGAMRDYLVKVAFAGRSTPCLIWPPYLSRSYQSGERLSSCTDRPNLLFMGRMDKNQLSDDVSTLLTDLMNEGVHVYHHCSKETPAFHPRAHPFAYMSLPEVHVYATQFDAALVAYNLQACGRTDRFEVTVPDRLVAAVSAGVPVAIPAQGYAAPREYLEAYRATIPFRSARELASRLMNRVQVDELRRLAAEDSAKYVGELHLPHLLDFLDEVSAGAESSTVSPLPTP